MGTRTFILRRVNDIPELIGLKIPLVLTVNDSLIDLGGTNIRTFLFALSGSLRGLGRTLCGLWYISAVSTYLVYIFSFLIQT